MSRTKVSSLLPLLIVVLCLANVCCAQTQAPRVGKAEALKAVKVAALDGWKEMVSDGGRFRILFHGEPVVADEPTGTGFEMKGDRVKWFALYNDFEFAADDATLKQKYTESVESIVKRGGSKLLLKRDVTLNGRLGVEFILLGRSAKSYMRAFQIGRRLYTLAVDDYKDLTETDAVPAEVQTFFDSFTFWE